MLIANNTPKMDMIEDVVELVFSPSFKACTSVDFLDASLPR
jgi:hypothetical protein